MNMCVIGITPEGERIELQSEERACVIGDQELVITGAFRRTLDDRVIRGEPDLLPLDRSGLVWLLGHEEPDICLLDPLLHGLVSTTSLGTGLIPLEGVEVQLVLLLLDTLPGEVLTDCGLEFVQPSTVWRQEEEGIAVESWTIATMQEYIVGLYPRGATLIS